MERNKRKKPENRVKRAANLALGTIRIWSEAGASRMSAALAYYTMLSLAPMLVLVVVFAGVFFGNQQAQRELLLQIETVSNPEIASIAAAILENTASVPDGPWTGLLSVAALLFGASGVFSQFFDTMNVIWGVKRSGLRYTVRQRLRGFLMVLVFGLLLVALLLLNGALTILSNSLGAVVPEGVVWLSRLETAASLLGLPLLFMMLYRFVPLRPVAWRDVWLGSIVGSGLFILARMGIAFYLSRSTVTSAYGAAGSLVVLLIWVYFSGMIIFLGAAFCRAYAQEFGSLRELQA